MLNHIWRFAADKVAKIRIRLKRSMKKNFKLQTEGNLVHLLNDPTTPNLIEEIPYAQAKQREESLNMKFAVENYAGGGYPLDSEPGRAANCYMTTVKTLEWFKQHQSKEINKWATTPSLPIFPESGRDLNAFYDRRSIQMFSMDACHTSNSCDILAHELGHGLLDAARPDTWSVQAIELWSFHEAFGDFCAMMTALQSDAVIRRVLKETNGELKATNIVSKVAEEVGQAIFQMTKGQGGRSPDHLRNAVNDYRYIDPTNLSEEGTYETISAECHSFSRIMTGALYDIFVMMYRHNLKKTGIDDMSVKIARNTLAKYVLKAVNFVPITPRFYEAFAHTILWVDFSDTKEYHDRMWEIFVERHIISPVKSLSVVNQNEIKGTIVAQSKMGSIVKTGKTEIKKFSDLMPLGALAYNPLYTVNVELASENLYIFDKNGNSIEYIETSDTELANTTKYCLDRLNKTNGVSDDKKSQFQVQENNLVRTYFDCNCRKEG